MRNTIAANIYLKSVKNVKLDPGGDRKTIVLDEHLQLKDVWVGTPVCQARLESARLFRVADDGTIQVATHQNNLDQRWLSLAPVWDADGKLRGIQDERGSDIRFIRLG